MQHKRALVILVLGALAFASAFGVIAYKSVYAAAPTITQTSPSTGTTSGTTSSSTQLGLGWEGGKGRAEGYTSQQLADALGITTTDLTTANQTAYSAALKDAVAKGLITQAQADQLTTNGNAFPFDGRWDGWLTQNGIDFNTYLASALGISVETLKVAYADAFNTNIDQMVTAGTLTQAQADLRKGEYTLSNDSTFQTSMQSAFTSAVNSAVSSGVISQSQADQILSNNSNFSTHIFGGMGGRGGPHGHCGGGFGPDNDAPIITTP